MNYLKLFLSQRCLLPLFYQNNSLRSEILFLSISYPITSYLDENKVDSGRPTYPNPTIQILFLSSSSN